MFYEFIQTGLQSESGKMTYKICPACETKNDSGEEYCLNCGQNLTEEIIEEEISNDKLKIPKDKIILLNLK